MTDVQKEKLLIVITKSNFGGAQRYVYDLAQSVKDTYDVTVLCGGEGLMKERLMEKGVPVFSIPFAGRNVNILKDVSIFFWMVAFIRKEKPSIVHSNSSKMGGITSAAVRVVRFLSLFEKKENRTKIRSIFTAHAWAFNENRGTVSKILITFFHWLTVALSDKTIAVSGAVKKQISHTPFIAHKITVIHPGIQAFTPLARARARAKLNIPQESFAIGTIAELHTLKGLTNALDAVKDLSFDFTYSIIGEGDERKNLEKQIADSHLLQKNVSLKGFVADASHYISAFDVFLLPSLSEAFGYVILEAAFAQTPVIASSVGGIPEIIEDMKSGILIHPHNTKEIARSLTALHADKTNRDTLALALREKVTTQFSLTKMAQETIAVYKS
jgi:glycosyltransferase involved in cell wall biosynthesis